MYSITLLVVTIVLTLWNYLELNAINIYITSSSPLLTSSSSSLLMSSSLSTELSYSSSPELHGPIREERDISVTDTHQYESTGHHGKYKTTL